jgi:hypothetical protein
LIIGPIAESARLMDGLQDNRRPNVQPALTEEEKGECAWCAVLDGVPGILKPSAVVRTMNNAVILDPACEPEFCPGPDLFHPHCLGAASQIDHIIGILRVMCRHNNIALDSLTGSYRLIQQAIEAILTDISSFRAQWVLSTIPHQVQGPMQCCARTPTSLDAGVPPCWIELHCVRQRIASCSRAHHRIAGGIRALCLPYDPRGSLRPFAPIGIFGWGPYTNPRSGHRRPGVCCLDRDRTCGRGTAVLQSLCTPVSI